MFFFVMSLKKHINILCCISIITFIIVFYHFYNVQNTERTSNFQSFNTSDILHHINFSNSNSNNSTIFGLQLRYNLSPASCDRFIKYVIIVTNHFHNVEARSAMRRAFDTATLKALHTKRVFLLGTVMSEATLSQASVENESFRFRDILQGNFQEAYRNLTYKHLLGLKWASEYCQQAKYIFKMDDDIVVDLRKIIGFISAGNLGSRMNSRLLAGYVLDNMVPKRDPANKWFVTHQEYPQESYPTFLSGWFYITNPQTAKLLYLVSKVHHYFWIDDTLITGVFAMFLQIKHINLAQHFTLHAEFLWCCIDDYHAHNYECPFFVGPDGGDTNLHIEFNESVGKCNLVKQCAKGRKSINDTCVGKSRKKLGPRKSVEVQEYHLF